MLTHFRSASRPWSAGRQAWDKAPAAKLADPSFAAKWENATTPACQRSLNWPEFGIRGRRGHAQGFRGLPRSHDGAAAHAHGRLRDLDPSNQTVKFREAVGIFNAATNALGRNLCFGVREFPMGAILNGLALHGGIAAPFGATFLVFSDYERNAIRMSALQHLPVLHVFTHDSFFVGEDGPTHQPIEHVSSLFCASSPTSWCCARPTPAKARPAWPWP